MKNDFVYDWNNNIVNTHLGKIRGYINDGTFIFHGIKYANAKRFQEPKLLEPWKGIKDAISYGPVCPLLPLPVKINELLVPHRFWLTDENCQYLNIWSPKINTNSKKPVMVWLHGGSFRAGSSIEHLCYDGEKLSKNGDVVVVSLNHRLNVLGYLNLSKYGNKYEKSGNIGQNDIICALKWIQENIENFGGDKNNITLFGQSGGGMKIASLLQMPEADGLFHKGIIQSGIEDELTEATEEESFEIASQTLKNLNIASDEIEKIETVSYACLSKAFIKAADMVKTKKGTHKYGYPVENKYYYGDARIKGFRKETAHIPLLIGSTYGEFNTEINIDKSKLSEEKTEFLLKKIYHGEYENIITLFKKSFPHRHIADLLDYDNRFRYTTKQYINRRCKETNAPVYSYLFDFDFNYLGYKPAWHCSEIPFIMNNLHYVPMYKNSKGATLLEEQMTKAWVQFARKGNPNNELLPKWPVCHEDIESTMIFKQNCSVKTNFDNELSYQIYKLNSWCK